MTNIGKPIRKVVVIPERIPIPQREPLRLPTPAPEKVLVPVGR